MTACGSCGWVVRNPREYHPALACLIVEKYAEDPLPWLREVAADMAQVDDEGVIHFEEVTA